MNRSIWAFSAIAMISIGSLAACGDDDSGTTLPPPNNTGGTAGGTAGTGGTPIGTGGFAGTGGGFAGTGGGVAGTGGGVAGTGGGVAGTGGGVAGTGGGVAGSGGSGGSGGGVAGSGGGVGGTGGGPGCPNCSGFPAGACQDCIAASCCTECERFVVNADAINIFNCVVNCTDAACEASCVAMYPAGQADYQALMGSGGCVETSCAQECLGGGACGSVSYTDPICNDCFETNCCNEGIACSNDPTCVSYLSCIQACADQTCIDDCGLTYPNGKILLDAIDACVNSNCASECGATGCGFTYNDPACNTCFEAECCATGAACAASADCLSYFNCVVSCSDAVCEAQCANQYPAGEILFDAMNECVFVNCSMPNECGGSCGGISFGAGACSAYTSQGTCDAAADCVWDVTGSSCESACNMCYQTNCCNEGLACAASADCGAYLWCLWDCNDAACEAACGAQHPTGLALLDAIDTCVEVQCDAECGNACGLAFSDPTCNTCFEANCCAEGLACDGSTDCTDYLSCVGGCTTQACADGCETTYSAGKILLDAVDTCVEGACPTECGINACGLNFADPTCNTCFESNCCAEGTACGDNLDCMTYLSCTESCADQACVDACGAANPAGHALMDTVDACLAAQCATECPPTP